MTQSPSTTAGPIIDVDQLRVVLGNREILHDVSFSVQAGDIFGFIGPNGSGKTTTIRAMLGLYQPDSGTVTIAGSKAGTDPARAATGFALDQDGLYGDLSAAENIAFFRDLYGCPRDPSEVTRILDQVGLADRADDKVRMFSKGMRQRVAIARAIAHDPQVIIMDEPTSGVDPVAQNQIHDLITDLVHSHGKTVLLSSHNLDEIQRLCNRIALIAQGRILLTGDLAQLAAEAGANELTITAQAPIDDATAGALRAIPELGMREVDGALVRLRPAASESVSDVVARLAAHGVEPENLTSNRARLEQIFASTVQMAAQDVEQTRAPARGATRAVGRR